MKNRSSASTLKKVVVLLFDKSVSNGYVDPKALGKAESIDLLTPSGEHQLVRLADVKSVYFVRDFGEDFEPQRKTFLSRPKLDGLWVRLQFKDKDEDAIEGIVPNNLLDLLDMGVHLTPPDLHGNSLRMFIPRSALSEMKVLGVVGGARRTPRAIPAEVSEQPRLFSE